jgi:hypothetical protein
LLQANGYKLSVEVQVNEEFFTEGYSKNDVYKLEDEEQVEESKEDIEIVAESEEIKNSDEDKQEVPIEQIAPEEEKIEDTITPTEESVVEATVKTTDATPDQPDATKENDDKKQVDEPTKTDEPEQTIEQTEESKIEEQKSDDVPVTLEKSTSDDKAMKDNNSKLNQDPLDEEHKKVEKSQITDEEKENQPLAESERQEKKDDSSEKVVVEVSESLLETPEQTIVEDKQILSEENADVEKVDIVQNEQKEETKVEQKDQPEAQNDEDYKHNEELEENEEEKQDGEGEEDSTEDEPEPTKEQRKENSDTLRMKELLFGKPKSDKNDNEFDPDAGKHIIDILFDFLRVETELNPVLCGYFCKFTNTLMNHNRKGFFSYVFDPENKVVEYLIKHIYNRSIADTLVKILCDYSEVTVDKKQFILAIIDSIETQAYEGKLNISMVLIDIMEYKS